MDTSYFENFIKNVKRMLNEIGMKQSEFALQLNCEASTVSKWLTGKREPSFYYIVKITHILKCSFEELIS